MNHLSNSFFFIIEKLKTWNATLADEFAQIINRQSDTTFTVQSITFQNESISDSTPPPNVLLEFAPPNLHNCDYHSIRLTIPITYPNVPPIVLLQDRQGNYHSYNNLLLDLWKNEPSVFNLTRLIHILINQPFPRKGGNQRPEAPPKPKTPTTNTANLSSNFHSLSLGSSKPSVPLKPSVPAKPPNPTASQVHSAEKIATPKKKDVYSSPSLPPRPAPYASSFQDTFQTDNQTKNTSLSKPIEKRNIQYPPNLPSKQTVPPIPSKPRSGDSFPQVSTNAIPSNNSTVNLLDEDIHFSTEFPDDENERRTTERKRLNETRGHWKEKLNSELMQQIKAFQSLRLKKELLDNEKRSLQELAKEIDKKRFLLGITRRKLRDDLQRTTTVENLPIEELFIIPLETDRKRYKLSSSDAVLNNSIQALNSALAQESVSIHAWLKAVKLLARQQFFVRDDLLHL
ncbi:ESCRT I complex subunit Vps23 [Schizosaccharomyces osmophilus]|uniref:ESCRT I complex subunit Vps23 n=1 Tax=Schizosaccharomyces osmophilus TaxID=2545709 RepID=A0AAE9WEM0_9SCHI|nr:ESCRT I complex subunit Vps23 [Schizosaccharomyces osmophilus]WBW74473.1 ESCRT I complex subunit Vps23 [Schizosaccharomyces osmophilus]